jgi:RNA polymerase sigma factor (sigma-70 family)
VPYAEQSIARRLLDEDPEALGQVMRWISGALAAPRFWHMRQEWPDLLQEVLARVLGSLRQERFDPSRDLRVYVQGIARFVSLEAMARRKRFALVGGTGENESAPDPSPESVAIRRQMARRVLDLSTRDCRELIRLYFFEARSYDEIASIHAVPPGTVKSRLFRCLQGAHRMLSRPVAPRSGRGSGMKSLKPGVR